MNAVDSLAFILVGFAVVMIALGMLWGVSALIGRIFVRFTTVSPTPTPMMDACLAPARSPGTIPPAHIAAITAAVAAITQGKGRVVSVLAPAQVFTSWAQEGRTEQFSSHRVRWDWAVPGPPHVSNEVPANDDSGRSENTRMQ